jgi:iron complex transport system ATP-binding protein
MTFSLAGAGLSYGAHTALSGITLDVRPGELTAIAGPNGAGKSTLVGVMAGLRPRYTGHCRLDGREVRDWPRRAFARAVSFVPQSLSLDFPFTAGQVVLMGRAPHADRLFEGPADHAAVERAMRLTDCAPFHHRDFRTLSGGERQRVILASALAQEPRFLLLDEPATFLDLRHQILMYRLLRDLCREGLGAVAVTHDLNTALTYADRVVLLDAGRVAFDGTPSAALTTERIAGIFGVNADVRPLPRPWIVYEP